MEKTTEKPIAKTLDLVLTKSVQNKLKDGRKISKIRFTDTRIWCTVDGIESAWSLTGKWRDDGIDSCADIVRNFQLTLKI